MIKVSLTTTGGRKSDVFAPNVTPRQIFDHFGVDYSAATNTLDGVKLERGDLDRTLEELQVGEQCRISSIVKMDNAASVEVTGNAVTLISGVKLEDWKRLEKYVPSKLKLYYDDDKEDVKFGVSTAKCGAGDMTRFGVTFGDRANAGGFATASLLICTDDADIKATIRDTIGEGLIYLNEIEATVPTLIQELTSKEAALDNMIKVN